MNSFDQMIPILKTKSFNMIWTDRIGYVDNVSSEWYLKLLREDRNAEAAALKRQEKDFLLMLEASKKTRLIKLKRIERCIFTTDYAILD